MLSFGFFFNVIKHESFMNIIAKEIMLAGIFAIIYTALCDSPDDFNGKNYAGQGLTCQNLFENFYFSAVTMFSVGYGDISPKSDKARLITLINMFLVMYIVMIYFPGKYPIIKDKK